MRSFYKCFNKPNSIPNAILLLIGLPLYVFTFFLLNNKLGEDLKQNYLDSLK